ncbi:replication-associated protein [Chicken proventriculitis-associated circular virus 10]|nr:replication-associated protein [Chicken proventriculitis-associated circular virus 10]
MEEPKSKTLEDKNFYFQSKYALLTYKYHIDKECYIEWLRNKNISFGTCRLAHETGDEKTPYEHTHVVINFVKRFQTKKCRFFDYTGCLKDGTLEEDIHPNIKILSSSKAFDDALIYIAKEDPDNEDLKPKKGNNWVKEVMDEKELTTALFNHAKKPSDVSGIMAVHNLKKTDFRINSKDRYKNLVLYDWQSQIEQKLLEDSKDSNILWICDEVGQNGKTSFGKYMRDKYEDDFVILQDLGNTYHASTIIYNMLTAGWKQKGIFINLTRIVEDHTRIYAYIEQIKDGEITVQKYSGKPIQFDPPHVVILANWLPKVTSLSLNRWEIYKLRKNPNQKQCMLFGPMNIEEISDEQNQ